MLIEELLVSFYGPVRDRRFSFAPGFNLLPGHNEAGKTLTIDALVKMLLGRQARDKEFAALQRVTEQPEGYVVVKDGSGESLKFPGQGDLAAAAGLSPAECANIFIIRNSDLSIARESEFYTTVTDRLTGLRTEEIAVIKKKLYDIANLTPTGQFRNVGEDKLKSRLDEAGETVQAIDSLHARLLEEGYDELEKEQVACGEALAVIEERLRVLEEARQRRRYEQGRAALDSLLAAREKLRELELFSDEDERAWAESERDMERLKQEQARLQADLGKKEEALRELNRALPERQRAFQLSAERKKAVDDEIRPGLKNYTAAREDLARRESRGSLYSATAVFAAILLAVSLLGALFRPGPFFYGIAAAAFVTAAFSWLSYGGLTRRRGAAAAALERIKAQLARYGQRVGSEAEVHGAVQALEDDHAREQAALHSLQGEIELLNREIAALRESALPGRERELSAAAAAVDSLKRKAGVENRQQYAARLKEKAEAGRAIDVQQGTLESLFGAGNPGADRIAAWTKAVSELAPFAGRAAGLNYDDKEVAALKERQGSLQEQRTTAGYRMAELDTALAEIERKANRALQGGDTEYLHCQTTGDLLAVRERLCAFVEEHGQKKEDAWRVIGIFEDIENEEQGRVAELFGAGSPVSGYFAEFTGGLYEAVSYDRARSGILVRREDGAVLAAEKLSGGAYDQLYLAIRLALAEKLLQGERGFFIMDDPFIKSDFARLRRQLQALLRIASRGWQIIYFTAKDEVREALRPELEAGAVNHISIDGIFT